MRIALVDDQEIADGPPPEVGGKARIEWTTSAARVVTCVLVHPMQGDTWWVQNLPGVPSAAEAGLWRWRTMAYFGDQELGKGEEFELLALAEGARNVCQTNRQLKVEEFPADLPRSEPLLVRRVRD